MLLATRRAATDPRPPSQPYDANYQQEHAIKHLSFHAHLRKLTSSAPPSASASSFIPPLSSPNYRVAVPCPSGSHPSWPGGICTKCQPSAVTLSRQTWRMVDHVEFSSPAVIEQIIGFWRQTAQQRFGYLLGRFEPYDKVPMGVKAVVEALHEPAQEPHPDGISVGFPWVDESKVEKIAAAAGLHVVGCLFTDLTPDPDKKATGQVISKRHAGAFFLSSLEVLFAAQLQRQHPTPSRFADTGRFSSRFVTCVVSGDVEGQISVEAYQVSDQAMGMVEADMVEPSVDPGVVRIKEEGGERYIPEVFYRYKNKYGLEVKESAKPCFPVEYLIVNVSQISSSLRTPANTHHCLPTFAGDQRFPCQPLTLVRRLVAVRAREPDRPAGPDDGQGGGLVRHRGRLGPARPPHRRVRPRDPLAAGRGAVPAADQVAQRLAPDLVPRVAGRV